MKLHLPESYHINYPNSNLDYYSGNNSRVIRDILFSASSGYCMYCGTSLVSDDKVNFQLEHSVDKEGNYNQTSKNSMLKNCKFNLSAACSRCNMIYKKRIEKVNFEEYELVEVCPEECDNMCKPYIQMRNNYCKNNAIILQPFGYSCDDVSYGVSYNLLRHTYEPMCECGTDKDTLFVMHHIMRFALNRENFSKNVVDICVELCELYDAGIVNTQFLFEFEKMRRPSNMIGVLFLRFLEDKFREKKINDLMEFCSMLVVLSVVV